MWTRSETEFPCGWYAAVRVFFCPKTDCYSLTNGFANSVPWLECSVSGGPDTEKTRSRQVPGRHLYSLFVLDGYQDNKSSEVINHRQDEAVTFGHSFILH